MDHKTKYILICLIVIIIVIIIVISGVFVYTNQTNYEIQKKNMQDNNKGNAGNIIPIISSKKEKEIIIDNDKNSIIIKEGEEIIVGE
ncbi:MAG: hypothetical protein KAS78_01250 [Candidatus Pacebacteria bacterium]|nr:hypothetical protein [Candidatus Paceibacterota bacterium]